MPDCLWCVCEMASVLARVAASDGVHTGTVLAWGPAIGGC